MNSSSGNQNFNQGNFVQGYSNIFPIGDGLVFSYGINNKKSYETEGSFPETLDSLALAESNSPIQTLNAGECLDLSVKDEMFDDSSDEKLFDDLDQYYVNFDKRAERMAPEEFAELERQQQEEEERLAQKAEETRLWKDEKKWERRQAKLMDKQRRHINKVQNKMKYEANKKAREEAVLLEIAQKLQSPCVQSETVNPQVQNHEQTFSNEQHFSNNADEQYYYENLERSRNVEQFENPIPRVQQYPVQSQMPVAPMQIPRAMPPRDIRVLAPPPPMMMRQPVHEPRLVHVAPPPPPPHGYRLAGPPPPPQMHPHMAPDHLAPRPMVRRVVRVPIPSPAQNDEIMRREHARREYERVVAIDAERMEHARREEWYREQERREFHAKKEHERRQIEMLRYEEATARRLAYQPTYEAPGYYAHQDANYDLGCNSDIQNLSQNDQNRDHLYCPQDSGRVRLDSTYIPIEKVMAPQYKGPQDYAHSEHAYYAPQSHPESGFERREFDHVYNAAYYN